MTTLFTNPLGITFERTDYKKRSKVRVHNNDYHLMTYRFNNVPEFESPYISWQNLDQCGGWMTRDDYAYTAVYNGTKLFTSIVHPNDVSFDSRLGVVVQTHKHPRLENYCYTYISKHGCLHDFYDLDSVFDHYSRLGIEFTVDEKNRIEEYCDIELYEFGTENAPFNFMDMTEREHFVVTGLLLGYPLESTASLIEEWF